MSECRALGFQDLSGLFATPWTIQTMAFSRPGYWGGHPIPSPGDLPNPGIKPRSPALQADSLSAELPGKPLLKVLVKDIVQEGKPSDRLVMLDIKVKVLAAQSCLTLCNLMDYSLSGSSIHGIFQTRILEWVVIPFSMGSSQSRDQTQVSHTVGRLFTT